MEDEDWFIYGGMLEEIEEEKRIDSSSDVGCTIFLILCFLGIVVCLLYTILPR